MGYRLVYAVEDDVLVVLVISVGKREEMAAYLQAIERLLTKRQNGSMIRGLLEPDLFSHYASHACSLLTGIHRDA